MRTGTFILPLAFASLLPLAKALPAEGDIEAAAKWANGVVSPLVCIGQATWFVGIVPEGVPASPLVAPAIVVDGSVQASSVIHFSPDHGLCLLAVPKSFDGVEPRTIASGEDSKPGDSLYCRQGISGCRSTVAGLDRSYLGTDFAFPMIRIRLEHGDQFCKPGMPLFDPDGGLRGILTGHLLPNGLEAFAVPAERLRKLVEEVGRYGRSGDVWIGIVFHEETATPEVVEVRAGSPAERAGVQPGDIVVGIAGQEIDDLDDLSDHCHQLTAGIPVSLSLLRGLETIELSLEPVFAAPHGQ